MKLAKFLRTPFIQNISGGCFWISLWQLNLSSFQAIAPTELTHLTDQFVQYNLLLADNQDRRVRIQDIVDTQFAEMSQGVILNSFSIFRKSKLRYSYKLYPYKSKCGNDTSKN